MIEYKLILIPIKGVFLALFASVFHEEAFFVFGGKGDYWDDFGSIGRLDAVTLTWSLAGSLKQARNGHAVIFDGTQFLVIGGPGEFKTENCVPNGDTVTCTEQQKGFDHYYSYPELMLVDGNYGNDCLFLN